MDAIARIAAFLELAREIVNRANHPNVDSIYDLEIIDFWRSAMGMVVLWKCKYFDSRPELISIPLSRDASNELAARFGI